MMLNRVDSQLIFEAGDGLQHLIDQATNGKNSPLQPPLGIQPYQR